MADAGNLEIGPDATLLLVDDDEPFLRRLARAMERRGFEPEMAESVAATWASESRLFSGNANETNMLAMTDRPMTR